MTVDEIAEIEYMMYFFLLLSPTVCALASDSALCSVQWPVP